MSHYGPNNGWTCDECGYFNEPGGYNCDSEECEMEREREVNGYIRRGLIHRFRQENRDECILRHPYGTIRYRARRYVGSKVRYRVEVDKNLGYAIEWYRVPDSVRHTAVIYFSV